MGTRKRTSRDLWVNALIGAVVTAVLSMLPFSPLLGGGVAGYLQKGDDRTGVRVGALSGALAVIPVVALLVLFVGGLAVVTVANGGVRSGIFFWFLLLVVFFFAVVYTVGLSAVGGFVGAALARENARSRESVGKRNRPTVSSPAPANPNESTTGDHSDDPDASRF